MTGIPAGWKDCAAHGYFTAARCPRCFEERESVTILAHDHHPESPRTIAQPEPAPKRERVKLADGATAQETSPERVHLRVVSVRKRLCDPDNLVAKWAIDCLRYCHIIRDDTAEAITLETMQRKTAKGEAEHTILEIIYPEIERSDEVAVVSA